MQATTSSTPIRPQTPVQAPALKVKTHLKAGGFIIHNHNETLVRLPRPATGLKVKTHIKAAGFPPGPS